MQISGVASGMNAVALNAQRGVNAEEAAEIKAGTTEEGGNARQAMKTAEMSRGLGTRIDIQS
ncbi:MAG TPA: hypothetical protein PKO22_01870 [Treponemataceae bacterium]|nr:hypothetical protein [Treponemataceae bacterium]